MSLGRGLSSLIPQKPQEETKSMSSILKDDKNNNSILEVDINEIMPNPDQPRKLFKKSALEDLALSIKEHGILQPIVVCRIDNDNLNKKYKIIAGERRFRASKLAGLKKVPVIVRDNDEEKTNLELAILENIQREDLTPIEKAKAYKQLADNFNMTHAEIAKKLGKGRVSISNTIRLLDLSDSVKDALESGDISENHARAILALPEEDMQKKILEEVKLKKLSARNTEVAVRAVLKRPVKSMIKQDPAIKEILSKLESYLGTKVIIKPGKHVSDGGELVIKYFSNEDLRSFTDKIVK